MSVPTGERKPSKLETFVIAKGLAAYTMHITRNPKYFKPEYRDDLTNKIVDCALTIYLDLWDANNIRVQRLEEITDPVRKREMSEHIRVRGELQTNAIRACRRLVSLIELAKPVFHLSTKRVTYWSQWAINVRNMARAWKESDVKRLLR